MAFEKKNPEYHTNNAYEDIEETHVPQENQTGARVSGGALFVLVFLLLVAAGVFLLYSDMKRDLRHGIYRCEDQRMLELPVTPDQEKISGTSERIKALAEAHPEISQYMMLVPSAACVQFRYLPKDIQMRDQVSDLSMVRQSMPAALSWIDLLEVFSIHSGEKLYYATDVYLTGWGSRYASNTAVAAMGADVPEGRDQCYLLSDEFRGRLAADGTLPQRILKTKKERLEIYVPEAEVPYYRTDGLRKTASASLYDADAVQREDQYDVFFGGERPLTEIRTGAVNGETLFVIGDRGADSIVTRFVSSFENIILIHPSKCTKKIEALIEEYQPTKILYLYGANYFMKDRTLLRFLGD